MGLGKDVVNNYIQGMKAQSDLQVNRIQQEVGGADAYNNMVKWASENLAEAEVNAFNNTMENGSGDDAILAAKGMAARYQATQSPKTQEPSLIKVTQHKQEIIFVLLQKLLKQLTTHAIMMIALTEKT